MHCSLALFPPSMNCVVSWMMFGNWRTEPLLTKRSNFFPFRSSIEGSTVLSRTFRAYHYPSQAGSLPLRMTWNLPEIVLLGPFFLYCAPTLNLLCAISVFLQQKPWKAFSCTCSWLRSVRDAYPLLSFGFMMGFGR